MRELLPQAVRETLGVGEVLPERLALGEEVADAETQTEVVPEAEGSLTLGDGVADVEPHREEAPLRVTDGELLGDCGASEGVARALREMLGDGVPEIVKRKLRVTVGVCEGDPVGRPVTDGVAQPEGERSADELGHEETLGLAEKDGDALELREDDTVDVVHAVEQEEGVLEREGVPEPDAVAHDDPRVDTVADAERLAVTQPLVVGVAASDDEGAPEKEAVVHTEEVTE